MSEAYRRLRDGLPATGGGGARAFPTEPKRVRAWVAALPRANTEVVQEQLGDALAAFVAQKVGGAQRLAVIEELRRPVLDLIAVLERQLAGTAFPLSPVRETAAQQAEGFHFALAQGYRQAAVDLCAPTGNVPFLRGGTVGQALERAAWHYSRALGLAWRVYRAPATGAWQGLHRVRAFAAVSRLDDKAVDDIVAGSSHSVGAIYRQTLLVAVGNPHSFGQSEQEQLWRLAAVYAPRSRLREGPGEGRTTLVPADADRGPGPGADDEPEAQWLDLEPCAADVEQALARSTGESVTLGPGRGITVDADLLTRLQRALGQAAVRGHARLEAGHMLDTVIGLSGLHYYLAGQLDFDAFLRQARNSQIHVLERAAWAHSSAEQTRVPTTRARVLDQSLGGYRLVWEGAAHVRARVGELVGLSLAADEAGHDWMVGMVRWLRYEPGGAVIAGVELLSRRAHAVGLRTYDADGAPRAPMRAIEMHPLERGGKRCYLAPDRVDTQARSIEVVRAIEDNAWSDDSSAPEILSGLELVLNAGEYLMLRPVRGSSEKS